jgi:hypothetical protein
MFERYGVVHPLHRQEFVLKREETVMEKYGVKNVLQSYEVKNKSKITKNMNKLTKFCNIRKGTIDTSGRKYQIKKVLNNIIKLSNCENKILEECIDILQKNIPENSQHHFKSAISTLKSKLS